MNRIGKENDSLEYWENSTNEYIKALDNPYHEHRLNVAFDLIPKELYFSDKQLFDFGYGDAVMFEPFIKSGAKITGCDIIPEMVTAGNERMKNLGETKELVFLGGVEALKELEAEQLDAILCFNVLAYLTDSEEVDFYEQAKRVLKKGGYLAVSHSNELFDMFSLNKYTVDFYGKNFSCEVSELISNPQIPSNQAQYNIRENPLNYKHKLLHYGFQETKQRFSNQHLQPPILLSSKGYPDTLSVKNEDAWKLMFTCSTYMSLSVKV